jgi:hypothetical protein
MGGDADGVALFVRTSMEARMRSILALGRSHGRRLMALAWLATAAFAAPAAHGNAPPPPGYRERQPLPEVPAMKVEVQPDVKEARLIIPRGYAPTPKPRADAEGFSPTRTVVAGVSLAGAMALGGIFLARRKSAGRAMSLAMLAGGAAGVLSAGAALADIVVPGQPYRPVRPPMPREDPPVVLPDGQVPTRIEWTDEGNTIRLIVSPEMLKQWHDAKPAPAAPNGARPPAINERPGGGPTAVPPPPG